MAFKHLSIGQFKIMLDERTVLLLDMRDEASFQRGHIEGSLHLSDGSIAGFINGTEKNSIVVVICYHGHSSQHAASFLVDQGFTDVYSLDGGYAAWIGASDH